MCPTPFKTSKNSELLYLLSTSLLIIYDQNLYFQCFHLCILTALYIKFLSTKCDWTYSLNYGTSDILKMNTDWSECKIIYKTFNKSLSVLSIPFVCFTDFCNGENVLMCTSTSPGPDCIDLTGIQLRDKYTHLCFLSVVFKGTIQQYTQGVHITFLCGL